MKGSVVSRDEKEAGLRAILNFGHTLGHAIETLLNFKLFHGQCVSVGMVGAAYLSYINGLISKEDLKRIEKVLASYDLPVRIEELNKEVIYNQMLLDKKTKNNIIHFILLSSIGKAVRVSHVNTDQIFPLLLTYKTTCFSTFSYVLPPVSIMLFISLGKLKIRRLMGKG